MLEQITWSQYGTTIGVTTALYYAGIGLLFYRKKIIAALNHSPQQPIGYQTAAPNVNLMGAILSEPSNEEVEIENEGLEESTSEDLPENMRTLDKTTQTGDKVSEVLSQLGVHTNSQEIVTALAALIKKQNSDGRLTSFRESLDWHMSQTALDSCGIALVKEELDAIWNGEVNS